MKTNKLVEPECIDTNLELKRRELEYLFRLPHPQLEDELDPIKEILKGATCEGNKLFLNAAQLERASYQKVDKVLQSMGGKWRGGKVKAHVFEGDPAPLLERYLQFEELPDLNPLSFFATKPDVARELIDWLRPENATLILDADAGLGALAIACRERFPEATIHLVECHPGRAEALRQKPSLGEVFEEDFLNYSTTGYTAVVINPPFRLSGDSKAYSTHIFKAWDCLKSGGQLIAIAPMGFTYTNDSRSKEFLNFVNQHGTYKELPPKSFEGTEAHAAGIFLTKS